jgi:hypothetical protein
MHCSVTLLVVNPLPSRGRRGAGGGGRERGEGGGGRGEGGGRRKGGRGVLFVREKVVFSKSDKKPRKNRRDFTQSPPGSIK